MPKKASPSAGRPPAQRPDGIEDDDRAVRQQDEDEPGQGPLHESDDSGSKPGDPDFDWSALYDTEDLYTHTFGDGTVVALKSFATIYSKTWLYKLRKAASNAEVEFAAIDRAACDEAQQVLENLDLKDGDPLDDLFQAWVKAGTSRGDGDEGLTPGN